MPRAARWEWPGNAKISYSTSKRWKMHQASQMAKSQSTGQAGGGGGILARKFPQGTVIKVPLPLEL